MPRNRKGERRHGNKWEVYVRVNGHLYTERLELTATPKERADWREGKRKEFEDVAPLEGSLAADIVTYGDRRAAMPTIKQRLAHLWAWARELGRDRSRDSITDEHIDAVLQRWLKAGLAPATVRKRRTALQSFFKTMDAKRKRLNPVKTTHNPRPPKVEARGLDYPTLERAVAAMPAQRDTKKGFPPRVSLSKLRARVILYTGLPPGIVGAIRRPDLRLDATPPCLRVPDREKGDGVEARTIPLNADAVAAFRDFDAADAYGTFAIESLNRAFKRGCVRAGIPWGTVHLYDIRHSYLSQVYRVTKDLATVGRLGLHRPGSPVTARYAMGANDEVDVAATAAFSASLAAQRATAAGPIPVPKLARKVGKVRKARVLRKLAAVV